MADINPRVLTRKVDDRVQSESRSLARSSRFGALSVLRPGDGFPAVSRVLCATDFSGRPVLLMSGLSLHAKALAADGRCSLLLGEPGKGDPLAHPRLSIFANARIVEPGSPEQANLRQRFLGRHPNAELYIDFPDFRFAVLEPVKGFLNGGFAKAYELDPHHMIDANCEALETASASIIREFQEHGPAALDRIAQMDGAQGTGWRLATLDRKGFELARGDQLRRIEFNSQLNSPEDVQAALSGLARG